MATSSSLDEFDIRDSFDALDDEKFGLLPIGAFYTMYLGLGYKPQITIEEMKGRFPVLSKEKFIPVETAIQILSDVSAE